MIVSRFTPNSRRDDLALVRLDRAVAGHKPLKLRADGTRVPEGTRIFAIGHSMGLPLKVAAGGYVRVSESISSSTPEDMGGNWFATSLDTTNGNSGGPVFNAETGLVEGITARSGGATFPEYDITGEGCKVTRVYGEDSVWGPEVNSVAPLLPYLAAGPGYPGEKAPR